MVRAIPPFALFAAACLLACSCVQAFEFDRDSCKGLLPNQRLHPVGSVDNGKLEHQQAESDRFVIGNDHYDDDGDEVEEIDEDLGQINYKLKPAVSGDLPFTLKTSATQYRRNRPLTVTISGQEFNGFILVAKPIASKKPEPVGTFLTLPASAKHLSCVAHHDAAVSKDTGGKMNLNFEWKAPNEDKGSLKFKATVVQKDTYWADILSPVITFNRFPPSFAECAKSKSCYRYSTKVPNCEPDECDYVVTTKTVEDNEIEFTIGGKVEGNSGYIGIGFTLDKEKMSHMDISTCVKSGKTVDIKQYTIENWSQGPQLFHKIEDVEAVDTDGQMIWCQYRRPLKGPGAHLADLSQSLHHAFLWGALNESTNLPILPSKDKLLFVTEPWTHSNTINMIHFVGGRAAHNTSTNVLAFLLFLTAFLQFLNGFV